MPAVLALREQSATSFTSVTEAPPAWASSLYDGRRVYLHTLQDKAIPYIGQTSMVQNSGVAWGVQTFNTSHSPFLSVPKGVCAGVVAAVEEFQKL